MTQIAEPPHRLQRNSNRRPPVATTFNPHEISLPVHLEVFGVDEESVGTSEYAVLIEALAAYRKTVEQQPKDKDQQTALLAIDDLEGKLQYGIIEHVSESSKAMAAYIKERVTIG